MRAAALALVLICGAAVVLWYANMLNSWVLGGLAGGLAAILLSIPISLAIFSYLSRRHDERLKAEEQEEVSLAQMAYYKRGPVEVFEAPAYALQHEEDDRYEDAYQEQRYQRTSARNLPVPTSSSPRMSVRRQQEEASAAMRQQMDDDFAARQRYQGNPATDREVQHSPRQTQRLYPGSYGRQTRSLRGTQQTEALRIALQEAAQQMDSATGRNFGVAGGPQTDQLRVHNTDRDTGAVRQPQRQPQAYPQGPQKAQQPHQYPETDQLARRQFIANPPRNPDVVTGSLRYPMSRRAPYMYDDDPIREELAQQLDPPSKRRSSLYERYQED
jgi:hypothetical protein